MSMVSTQPGDVSATIWARLDRARGGVTAREIASEGIASESYTRRILRCWAKAGHLICEPAESMTRTAAARYRLAPNAPVAAPVVTTDGQVIPRDPAMSQAEFGRIRRNLGLSLTELGIALGWSAAHRGSLSRAMRRFEKGERPINQNLADKLRSLPGGSQST